MAEQRRTRRRAQLTNGNGAQPSLNVLAQYVKDLSFESPGAPNSLRGRDKAPGININVNVNANPLSDKEFDVNLTLNAKASFDKDVLFNVELVYGGVFRIERLPAGAHAADPVHRMPAPAVPVRPPDHRRRDAQWRLPAADARPDRFRADVPAEARRRPGQLPRSRSAK